MSTGLVRAKKINLEIDGAGSFCYRCRGQGGNPPDYDPSLVETFHPITTINGLVVCVHCKGTGITGGEP